MITILLITIFLTIIIYTAAAFMKWMAKVLISIGMFALRIFVNISCKLIKKVYNLIRW